MSNQTMTTRDMLIDLFRPSRPAGAPLRLGVSGPRVRHLSRDLAALGFLPGGREQVLFDRALEAGLRRFQVKGVGENGLPLAVDGVAGRQTQFGLDLALGRVLDAPNACIAPPHLGERTPLTPALGWRALQAALGAIEEGAQEIGGPGRGVYCRRYLDAAGLREGKCWSTPFIGWCLGEPGLPDAGRLVTRARARGWSLSERTPACGDVLVWTSELTDGFVGHAGLVVCMDAGRAHTIEAGRTPFVEFFHHDWATLAPLVTVIRPQG